MLVRTTLAAALAATALGGPVLAAREETAAPSREEVEARAESLAGATLVVDFATIVGVDVMNFDGKRLGQARAVLIHGNDGPSHLIVQSGQAWEQDGTKGAVAIPFDRVNWDRASAAFYVDMSEQALEKAPEFARAGDRSVEANNQ